MMPTDRERFLASFAKECVSQGVYFGVNPHYMLGVAQVRSGISDGGAGDEIGPFRLKQTLFEANLKDDEFEVDFSPEEIKDWSSQCTVFALMVHRVLDAFVAKNNRNPSAYELYLQQWTDAPKTLSDDLQKALDATAPLLGPAAEAVLDDPQSLPPRIVSPDQRDAQPAIPQIKLPAMLATLRDRNEQRWKRMKIDQNRVAALDKTAARLVAAPAKAQYQTVSNATNVPWFVIAVIHEREASQRWDANIAQGDPWNKVSTNVPIGRGPFKSWYDAAVDALTNCSPRAAKWADWSIGGTLTLLEQYNGLGYAYRNLPSPYIWGGTDQYVQGKFTKDHYFDAGAVDQQLGCAPLFLRMKILHGSIPFVSPGAPLVA